MRPCRNHNSSNFLSVLRQSAGQHLLRVKGIVGLEEDQGRPLIVHGVQHVMSDPVRLEAWPDDDRRTRLVFITSGIDPEPVRELFSALISEPTAPFGGLRNAFGNIIGPPLSRISSCLSTLSRRSS
jgi:G3E family GTPase